MDATRVLSFNFKSQKFDSIKFNDKDYKFQKNYSQENSLILNDKNGLFIITGTNCDQFYYFNMLDSSMSFISTLKSNHKNGGLVADGFRNALICLSGTLTNSVEKYVDDYLVKGYYSFEGRKTYPNQSWSNFPELKHDREKAGYVIVNDCIYAMFGYSNTQKKYIETIERIPLSNYTTWEEIKLTSDAPSLQLRSFTCIEDSDNNRIIIFGGQDGSNWKSNKGALNYNYIQSSVTVNSNFAVNNNNSYFNRVTGLVPFYLDSTFSFAGFDDNNKAYLIEPGRAKFGVFCYP
jgi:hypothetical protein